MVTLECPVLEISDVCLSLQLSLLPSLEQLGEFLPLTGNWLLLRGLLPPGLSEVGTGREEERGGRTARHEVGGGRKEGRNHGYPFLKWR